MKKYFLGISLSLALVFATVQSMSALTRVPVNMTQLTGTVQAWAGPVAPSWGLFAYGQAVSRTTYANLFAVLCPSIGVITVTIASPAVVTRADHGLSTGDRLQFSTAGALPTGISAATDYYVISVNSSTFRIATSFANAQAGTAINTSGSQSGVHQAKLFPHGSGNGTTTFNVPDLRGRSIFGDDDMGGTAASRITYAGSGVAATVMGHGGGDQFAQQHSHTQAAHDHGGGNHTHNAETGSGATSAGYFGQSNSGGGTHVTAASGAIINSNTPTINNSQSGGAQNIPPVAFMNWVIVY